MKRLSESEIRAHFDDLTEEALDQFLAVRKELLRLIPDAREHIKWKGLSYQKEHLDAAVKGGICQLVPKPDRIELAFIHGAFLPDPKHLLRGSGKYKRYIILKDASDLRKKAVMALLRASIRYDPRKSFDP